MVRPFLIALLVIVLAAASSLGSETAAAPNPPGDGLFSVQFTSIGACTTCYLCGSGHANAPGFPEAIYVGEIHDCAGPSYSCSDHEWCWVSEDDDASAGESPAAVLEALRLAFVNHHTEALVRLVEGNSRMVLHVPERQALQVYGCNDQVLAHFPLSVTQHAAFLAAADAAP